MMRERIDADAAIAMLDVRGGRVHTFRNPAGMLLGADWDLPDIEDAIRRCGCELSGEMATGMGHGLVLFDGPKEPVFVATKPTGGE